MTSQKNSKDARNNCFHVSSSEFKLCRFCEFPDSDILAIVCGDNLLHPNSQASDLWSNTCRNIVDVEIFSEPSSFHSLDNTTFPLRA